MVDELNAWLASPEPATFPYEAVVGEYRRVGKHFVAHEALQALVAARTRLTCLPDPDGKTALLCDFLEIALDKWDGRYDYPTYTGLAVLPLPTVEACDGREADARQRRDRLVALLAADAIAFELEALAGGHRQLPGMRPPAATVSKRCRLALRVARPALQRLGLAPDLADDDPESSARALCAAVARISTPRERRALELSMLPVYVLHDEYLFIRVLQMFEATFAMLGVQISGAVRSLSEGDFGTAAGCVRLAEATLHESAPLFSLLGTMQVKAFRTFRAFTDGASAIQSRNYKIMESLCRRPDAPRLGSPAYTSTPDVRALVLAGGRTLDEAFQLACASGGVGTTEREDLEAAMNLFAATLKRWRQTHYRLAVRMLGESTTGTGRTEGTGYLRAVRTIDVFRSVSGVEEVDHEAA
jgi:tryptophan 2,3-dioxygenase